MVICNLDALLRERHLKISKVAADTRISRTTLTALCNNAGKGIQFDTANTLCIYLGIGMEQLFTTLPYDIAGVFDDIGIIKFIGYMVLCYDGTCPVIASCIAINRL